MNWHVAWLWLWFAVGMLTYMAQRAYYGVQGPRPVATSYRDYVYRCWGPLLMRAVVDSGIYWVTFTPQALAALLRFYNWQQFASAIEGVTSYGFFALFFGLGVDVAIDFGVTKIPLIRDNWPQMPPPLPQPAIVQAAIVETKITALETTTTTVPNVPK
jgi:hypothetical protein